MSEDAITIYVNDVAATTKTTFKVKPSVLLSKIFGIWAEKKGVGVGAVQFVHDGENLKPDDTVKMAELEDGATIDAAIKQTGGCKAAGA